MPSCTMSDASWFGNGTHSLTYSLTHLLTHSPNHLLTHSSKLINIAKAQEMVTSAASKSDIVVLPEVWNSPYATQSFPVYAEPIPDVGGKVNKLVITSISCFTM